MDQLLNSGEYTYRVFSDGTAEITKYNGYVKTLEIPSRLDEKTVTSIASEAFIYCKNLISVTIPMGVTTIGDRVFDYCNNLTSVTIPDSVTSMGANPFRFCGKSMDIKVSPRHDYLEVRYGVLFSKPDNRLIRCPETMKGEYVIPRGISIIGDGAFTNCISLTSVTIP
jgi:hypothetical protein